MVHRHTRTVEGGTIVPPVWSAGRATEPSGDPSTVLNSGLGGGDLRASVLRDSSQPEGRLGRYKVKQLRGGRPWRRLSHRFDPPACATLHTLWFHSSPPETHVLTPPAASARAVRVSMPGIVCVCARREVGTLKTVASMARQASRVRARFRCRGPVAPHNQTRWQQDAEEEECRQRRRWRGVTRRSGTVGSVMGASR